MEIIEVLMHLHSEVMQNPSVVTTAILGKRQDTFTSRWSWMTQWRGY